jgi:hypothetical protein
LAPAAGAAPAEPVVPTAIAVPDGHKLFLVGHASGVQIYSCNGASWGLVAPRADLVDDNGKVIVTHFGGPSWQAKDGSLAVGARDGSHPVAGTIPWLRLTATSTPGADGDRLAGTTYIQRIATTGGLAPAASECDPSKAGTVVEVPYTADYFFWKARGA